MSFHQLSTQRIWPHFSLFCCPVWVRNSGPYEMVHKGRLQRTTRDWKARKGGKKREYCEWGESKNSIPKRKLLLGQGRFCIILLSPGREEIIILGVCHPAQRGLSYLTFWSHAGLMLYVSESFRRCQSIRQLLLEQSREVFDVDNDTHPWAERSNPFGHSFEKVLCMLLYGTEAEPHGRSLQASWSQNISMKAHEKSSGHCDPSPLHRDVAFTRATSCAY